MVVHVDRKTQRAPPHDAGEPSRSYKEAACCRSLPHFWQGRPALLADLHHATPRIKDHAPDQISAALALSGRLLHLILCAACKLSALWLLRHVDFPLLSQQYNNPTAASVGGGHPKPDSTHCGVLVKKNLLFEQGFNVPGHTVAKNENPHHTILARSFSRTSSPKRIEDGEDLIRVYASSSKSLPGMASAASGTASTRAEIR